MLAQTISSKKTTAPISISSAAATRGEAARAPRRRARSSLVAVAVVGGNPRRQHTHFFLRLLGRAVGGNAPDDHQRPRPARPPVQILGVEGERRPELSAGRRRELEVRRHYANHGVLLRVELNRSADDARFLAEDAPPERVAQDDDPGRAEQPFFRKNRAAEPTVRRTANSPAQPDAGTLQWIADREREIARRRDRFGSDIGLPVFERGKQTRSRFVGVDFPGTTIFRILAGQRLAGGLDDAESAGVRADVPRRRRGRDKEESAAAAACGTRIGRR